MGSGDSEKPRGKMSSYALPVQACREWHKEKHPDASGNSSELSKRERQKTTSAKDKGKFEDVVKADKPG